MIICQKNSRPHTSITATKGASTAGKSPMPRRAMSHEPEVWGFTYVIVTPIQTLIVLIS